MNTLGITTERQQLKKNADSSSLRRGKYYSFLQIRFFRRISRGYFVGSMTSHIYIVYTYLNHILKTLMCVVQCVVC